VISNATSYELPSNSGQPFSVAFSPDGTLVATADNVFNSVTLFRVTNGLVGNPTSYQLPGTSKQPQAISFSPNGSLVATANFGTDDVSIFKLTNGTLDAGTSYSLPENSKAPSSLAFSPNGSYLATLTQNPNTITIFPVSETGTLGKAVSYPISDSTYDLLQSLTFSPDNTAVATANSYSNTIVVSTFRNGALDRSISFALPLGSLYPNALAFSPDGSFLASANGGSNDITLFNAKNWCNPIPSSTTGPTKNHASCSKACIAGISIGGVSLLAAVIATSILVKKYYSQRSAEEERLVN